MALQPDPSTFERFSFWKPDPVPPKDATILPVELCSLGRLQDVARKLCDVPRLAEVPRAPWEVREEPESLRLHWDVDQGVILRVKTEQGPPRPGEVLTIGARSATPSKVFYRLYVQLYEQFGVTLLDERTHDFLTPRDFRTRLAG